MCFLQGVARNGQLFSKKINFNLRWHSARSYRWTWTTGTRISQRVFRLSVGYTRRCCYSVYYVYCHYVQVLVRWTYGFFSIGISDRKSDRRSTRQKKSGKINLLKRCLQWDLIFQQQPSLLCKAVWCLTNYQTCVERDVLNKFCFVHHLTFWTLGNFWNQ